MRNKYTYVDHGDAPPGQYCEDVILFECEAESILEADKLCRKAGHNPTLWHVGTQIIEGINDEGDSVH